MLQPQSSATTHPNAFITPIPQQFAVINTHIFYTFSETAISSYYHLVSVIRAMNSFYERKPPPAYHVNKNQKI